MFEVKKWTPELDLAEFYATADAKGFVNNASQKMLVDSLAKEKEWCVWILYYNNKAIGSVGAHSFPEMGDNAYRVLARTCTFGDARPSKGLITPKKLIAEHQNLTDQFLLPTCIEWTKGNRIFATSNESTVASQRLVHRHYFPTLAKLGIVKLVGDMLYRNTEQTVWQIFPDKFLEELSKYPRWC